MLGDQKPRGAASEREPELVGVRGRGQVPLLEPELDPGLKGSRRTVAEACELEGKACCPPWAVTTTPRLCNL